MANFGILQPVVGSKILGTTGGTPMSQEGSADSSSLLDILGGIKGLIGSKAPSQPPGASFNPTPSSAPGQYLKNAIGLNPAGNNTDSRLAQIVRSPGAQSGNGLYDTASKWIGLTESDPVIKTYLQKANPGLDPALTPWCAGFVGSVLQANGMKGTGSLAAKSYLNFGTPTNTPQIGDVVVLNRTNDPNLGHVGFYAGSDDKGNIKVLGGNQNNRVSIETFPASRVAGFRTPPSGQQVQQAAVKNGIQDPSQLPAIQNKANNQPLYKLPNANPELDGTMAGIAYVESSEAKDPYQLISKASKNGDRSYGKYQIMGANIPGWTREALGYPMTIKQFLADPKAQEQTAAYHINKNLQQYGNIDDAFSVWFSGRPAKKAGNAKDAYGTTVPMYIKKAREGYTKAKGGINVSSNDKPTLHTYHFNDSSSVQLEKELPQSETGTRYIDPNNDLVKGGIYSVVMNSRAPIPASPTQIPGLDPRIPLRNLTPEQIAQLMRFQGIA